MKIFITGVSSGIGKEFVIRAINQGHEVWGLARRKELLEELKKELGNNLKFSVCNIEDPEDMRQTAAKMRRENFLPDVVVLNAAVKLNDAEKLIPFESVKSSVGININGSLFWVSEFLPDFINRNSGTFIATSSTAALRPVKDSISYSATKSALDMAFQCLRLNYSDKNIKFTTVRFGPIETAMWEGSKSFLVSSPKKASKFIFSLVDKKSGIYYFPFLSTLIFRLLLFLPDKTFGIITSLIKK
ncbi:MAG: hypothetical protein A2655_01955 [Candidatus Yanofskybacteria bacterium RIFCSPHIGHO2_01_FULL_43_42]|uniref:Short-chain dehydrogenase n=1 Tax=Candidatus Yanofskybacteria bacterium RIFCSPLOWO2_01_FULL_43_22 TaxID=1802695 RepID=A0A1F8GJQ1_9BACT|nr:MAG: hypothetical protein A2655_01955 [Candidatus Yanofskybacteria bacterium RIFCSPHIGHO2_01_FULL_43_42]OGN13234.1 MAG: hypothetical protein A3D48_02860 [Candidatus Yanofskybacteria bacterium RIFCSPHIGHO2_02_FULL_43_17]OGN24649.1 MAG: hypothetical protein A3A13_01085 [Candidatus Yanofskybacteria bacterium RIFCSPLOWO2_01_FULL_43_22]